MRERTHAERERAREESDRERQGETGRDRERRVRREEEKSEERKRGGKREKRGGEREKEREKATSGTHLQVTAHRAHEHNEQIQASVCDREVRDVSRHEIDHGTALAQSETVLWVAQDYQFPLQKLNVVMQVVWV
jgi:hypothetical protein